MTRGTLISAAGVVDDLVMGLHRDVATSSPTM